MENQMDFHAKESIANHKINCFNKVLESNETVTKA